MHLSVHEQTCVLRQLLGRRNADALNVLQQLHLPPDFAALLQPSEETSLVPMQARDLPQWSTANARSITVAKLAQNEQSESYLFPMRPQKIR